MNLKKLYFYHGNEIKDDLKYSYVLFDLKLIKRIKISNDDLLFDSVLFFYEDNVKLFLHGKETYDFCLKYLSLKPISDNKRKRLLCSCFNRLKDKNVDEVVLSKLLRKEKFKKPDNTFLKFLSQFRFESFNFRLPSNRNGYVNNIFSLIETEKWFN